MKNLKLTQITNTIKQSSNSDALMTRRVVTYIQYLLRNSWVAHNNNNANNFCLSQQLSIYLIVLTIVSCLVTSPAFSDTKNNHKPKLNEINTKTHINTENTVINQKIEARKSSEVSTITPILIGKLDTGDAREITVVRDYAYIAAGIEGLKIVNINNPAAPILVSSLKLGDNGYANGVKVQGNYAYVANYQRGLEIINIENPFNPFLMGNLSITCNTDYGIGNDQVTVVTVAGNYAYIICTLEGLRIINIENPAAPVLVGNPYSRLANDVAVVGNYAYVASYLNGLKIFNVADPGSPFIIAELGAESPANIVSATQVAAAGNYAYVTDSLNGIKIINIENPAAPVLVGNLISGCASWVIASENYVYVAIDDALKIINVENPVTPIIVASFDIARAYGIAVVGDIVYVTNHEDNGIAGGLKIIRTKNSAPAVTAVAKSQAKNTVITFTASDFTGSFNDPDNDVLNKIKITSLPSNGMLALSQLPITANQEINIANINKLTYTPKLHWYGIDSFNWSGSDGAAYAVNTANATITITSTIPVITPIIKSGIKNKAIIFSVTDFTGSFTDLDDNILNKVKITSLPTNGILKLAEKNIIIDQEIPVQDLNKLVYIPIADWIGNDTFEWNGSNNTAYSKNDTNVNIIVQPSWAETNAGAIAGVAIGGAAFIAAPAAGIVYWHKYKQRKSRNIHDQGIAMKI